MCVYMHVCVHNVCVLTPPTQTTTHIPCQAKCFVPLAHTHLTPPPPLSVPTPPLSYSVPAVYQAGQPNIILSQPCNPKNKQQWFDAGAPFVASSVCPYLSLFFSSRILSRFKQSKEMIS